MMEAMFFTPRCSAGDANIVTPVHPVVPGSFSCDLLFLLSLLFPNEGRPDSSCCIEFEEQHGTASPIQTPGMQCA